MDKYINIYAFVQLAREGCCSGRALAQQPTRVNSATNSTAGSIGPEGNAVRAGQMEARTAKHQLFRRHGRDADTQRPGSSRRRPAFGSTGLPPQQPVAVQAPSTTVPAVCRPHRGCRRDRRCRNTPRSHPSSSRVGYLASTLLSRSPESMRWDGTPDKPPAPAEEGPRARPRYGDRSAHSDGAAPPERQPSNRAPADRR